MSTYELVYLHSMTDERIKVHDRNDVRYVEGGMLIRLSKTTTMFVPSHRIISEIMPVEESYKTWFVGKHWVPKREKS